LNPGFHVLIPYNTDAPIYHFPAATIGLIAVNTLVFIVTVQADPQNVVPWILQFGAGLHPLQWVSNIFLHAGFLHILGNMFYLWGFGLVVEGKLGWWRFLLVYLAIGAISSAIEQLAMLDAQGGGALGASGAIFGLMVIALVWAPKNEMSCFFWILFHPMMIELPITVFATTYLVWQGIVAWLTHFSMSSAMLHLTGAAVGAVFGVVLLKLDYVDCEGWDLFAWWHDTMGARKEEAEQADQADQKMHDSTPRGPKPLDEALSLFLAGALRTRLANGDAAGAADLYQKQRAAQPAWKPSATDLLALIQLLHKQQLWKQSVAPMLDYLRQYPDPNARLRLTLAEILLDTRLGPAKALKVLAKVPTAQLMPEVEQRHKALLARAVQQQADADFEFADDEEV
jgi:membrane associated rhomboid family serine protease